MDANICGEKVKQYRKKLGMAQIELAEALNVDHDLAMAQSDISEIERLARGVKDFELKALSEVLQVSLIEFLSNGG